MAAKPVQSRQIDQIIETQMRQWELARDEDKKTRTRARLADGKEIDYITISREPGSGGTEVGRLLAEMLKWQLYDKEILDHMAKDLNVQKGILESVDERTIGWIEDWLTPLFTDCAVDQLGYYQHLSRDLMVIGKHGDAVILGRAAGLILPRDKGLNVLVTAPLELRCRRYAKTKELSEAEAKDAVEKIDRDRANFVKDFLRKDVNDCSNYDIVVNTEKLSATSVAKLIWRALDQRKANLPQE